MGPCSPHRRLTRYAVSRKHGYAGMEEAGLCQGSGCRSRSIASSTAPGMPEGLPDALLGKYRHRYADRINVRRAANERPAGVKPQLPPRHARQTLTQTREPARPRKIRVKIAGGLRTMAGVEGFCRLRCYLSCPPPAKTPISLRRPAMVHNESPKTSATNQISQAFTPLHPVSRETPPSLHTRTKSMLDALACVA